MKCFFAISGENNEYFDLIKTLVHSAKKNTNLDLYCIYNGLGFNSLDWLTKQSVSTLNWEISFLNDFQDKYDGLTDRNICKGMYLCTELPLVLQYYNILDEYILYVDVDTIFCGPIELGDIRPEYLSCTPDWALEDWSRYGTGVILMNVKNMLNKQTEFHEHLKSHNYNFEHMRMGPCDQGAWNSFFHKYIERLDPLYDWKPWWGINDKAKIIHFAGPKPAFINICLNKLPFDKRYTEIEYLRKLLINEHIESYTHYLKIWENI
ncbi:MAG: hypothetical protein JWP78_618 [Mucilaginibacter sp.]|nr:hypothetical protein [Mucilaginibacter sp.]